MKRLFACTALLIATTAIFAQKPAASPAETATATIGGKAVTIKYNSPRVNGRAGKLFSAGGQISHDPHYPVWRAGANAATTLVTESNLKIGTLNVPAGTYTLFVDISDPDHWKLIVNKKNGEWGLAYDKAEDLGSTPMTMANTPVVENLTYTLADNGGGKGSLTLAWENRSASVQISAE